MARGNKRRNISLAKELQVASRRKKVAEMLQRGETRTYMAKVLGVSFSTIARDCEYLEDAANRQKLRQIAEENQDLDLIPANHDEYKEQIQQAVVDLVLSQKTYREIASETGLPLATISSAVNGYLREVGDFAGRTADEWRTHQLLIIQEVRARMMEDAMMQPVPSYGADGEQNGWHITPSRAAQARASAAKVLIELQNAEAKLMGLYQQKTEVKVTREVVHEWAGVDTSAWPTDVMVEGEWDAVD